jgi:ParB-like chromosome segregation protein Spo0J
VARRYEKILLKVIHVEDGRLPLLPSHVDQLAESIKEVGLLEPIIVCRRSRKSPAVVLVAGRNRLEACKRLKHETIAAIVETDESDEMDRWRELAEIDENLIRRELTPAERSSLTARRKKIYEEAHPETKQGARAGKKGRKSCDLSTARFTADTAKKTGKSERAVQLDAARGEALAGDLDKIAGTSLDKGVELDALAKMTPEQRAPLIERAAAGQDVSAVKAEENAKELTACEIKEMVQAVVEEFAHAPDIQKQVALGVTSELRQALRLQAKLAGARIAHSHNVQSKSEMRAAKRGERVRTRTQDDEAIKLSATLDALRPMHERIGELTDFVEHCSDSPAEQFISALRRQHIQLGKHLEQVEAKRGTLQQAATSTEPRLVRMSRTD